MKSMKYLIMIVTAIAMTACGRSCSNTLTRETPVRGNATVLVDQTVLPVMISQAQIFNETYPLATINLDDMAEQDISALLRDDSSARIAVLARPLTPAEEEWCRTMRINPKVNPIAFDGIALITNSASIDTMISTDHLRALLRGEEKGRILIFDNPKSSTVRYMHNFAETDSLVGVYTLHSNSEVIEYVAQNPNTIGFVGSNWLFEPDSTLRPSLQNVKLMAVGNETDGYFKPTQNNIADNLYPFSRRIYFHNLQGSSGLGLGFSAFIVSDKGQRIVLQSGILPVTYPTREIIVRSEI